jgi:hypothetical protein
MMSVMVQQMAYKINMKLISHLLTICCTMALIMGNVEAQE